MLRHNSSVQSVLVYATFFTISVMVHMVVVWPQPRLGEGAGGQGAGSQGARPTEGAAPVASARPAQDARSEGTQTGARPSADPRAEVLK